MSNMEGFKAISLKVVAFIEDFSIFLKDCVTKLLI